METNKIKLIAVLLVMHNMFCFGQRIPLDKQEHFAAGAIAGGFYTIGRDVKHPFWSSVAAATTVGVLKECYDSRTNGVVSAGDIYATIAGGVVTGGISYLIKRKKVKKILKFKKHSLH